jgi:Do/DeqQ family serine protease
MKRHCYILVLLAALIAIKPAEMQAKPRVLPQSAQQVQLSFAPLVKHAAPAVVNIFTTRKVQVQTSPFLSDPFFGRLFNQHFGMQFGARTKERVVNSLGSGVIVSADGLILTNHHVIEEMTEIRVVLSDRREFSAELILDDPRADLALLKIQAEGEIFPYLSVSSAAELEVGDLILAIGNPFGVGQTVTSGIVSALARTAVGVADYEFFIQTDAAINPGNSGGALLNMNGELVGLPTAIFSRDGGSNGIGFAIPIAMAESLLYSYGKGEERVIRPWLGASTQTVTPEIAETMNFPYSTGVLINDIVPQSAADKAGLRVGDIITAVEGEPIYDEQTLKFMVGIRPIGKIIRFATIREQERREIDVELQAPIEYPKRDTTLLEGPHLLQGAIVENLSPAVAVGRGLHQFKGVVVVDAQLRTPARRVVQTNDVIELINDQAITSVEQLEQVLAQEGVKAWQMVVKRGAQRINVNVRY